MTTSDDETSLENQLQHQLEEQRDSLAAVTDALSSDPSNPELISVHEELVQAIKDAEEGLLSLKRFRLLREVDSVFVGAGSGGGGGGVKAEPINPNEDDVEIEEIDDEEEEEEDKGFCVGSKCRFRNSDGRWYDGQIVELEGTGSVKVSFLTPTSENQLMCKFFLQQRCRFGTSCRLSHGVDVPLSSLRKYLPTVWGQSLVGSTIWALSNSKAGIWKEAELESWDDDKRVGRVVFQDDRSSATLGTEAMTVSEYALNSDEEETDSEPEESDSSDHGEVHSQGIGFVESTALQKGIQKETAIFANWENHTRGIASKLMANMGYREGMGLGVSGQGILDPVLAKVLPPKQSLDHALQASKTEKSIEKPEKKRSRGGKRKREKKFAAAVKAAKEEEESSPDLFSLINRQLAMHSNAPKAGAGKKQKNQGPGDGKKVDRRALVAYEDEIKDLRLQVGKLEEMVKRNSKEKVVYEAAMRKLIETRKALEDAEATRASASNAVVSKEKEKKWLKF